MFSNTIKISDLCSTGACLSIYFFSCIGVSFLGKGGDLTLFMTGKKPRPSTEPMYSGGNCKDFPVDEEFDRHTYTDLISAFVKKTQNILLLQNLHDGHLSGCFGTSKLYSPTPARAWGIRSNYDSFVQLVEEMWNKGYDIYSLACDERFGLGVFFMKDFGTDQCIVPFTSSTIQKKANEGLKITACAARGSTFYVVMTKGTKEYNGKAQSWFTSNTCSDAGIQIKKGYKEGKRITGICYSVDLHNCFVVMTEEPSKWQAFGWFDASSDAEKWIDEKVGGDPTGIEFYASWEGKFVVIVTKDKNIWATNAIRNFRLK